MMGEISEAAQASAITGGAHLMPGKKRRAGRRPVERNPAPSAIYPTNGSKRFSSA
jgi:hypothetical protein